MRHSSITYSIRTLYPLLPKAEGRRFVFLLVLAVVMALAELALTGMVALLAAIFANPEAVLTHPGIMKFQTLTGMALPTDPRVLALFMLLGIVIALLVKDGLNVWQTWQMSTLSEKIAVVYRGRVFRIYQKAPYVWLANMGPADINFGMNAATQSVFALTMALTILTNLLMIIMLMFGLLAVSPALTLMFIGGLGIGGTLLVRAVRIILTRLAKKAFDIDFVLNRITLVAIYGLLEMRLYGRENPLYENFMRELSRLPQVQRKLTTMGRMPIYCLEVLAFGTLFLVMAWLLYVQEAGMARISGIMGFLAAAAWRALPVANRLVESITSIKTFEPYIARLVQLLEEEKNFAHQEYSLREANPDALPFTHSISCRDVTFTYPKGVRPSVAHLHMTIPKGSMLGVVGLSGAGKSTLVNLLIGLLPLDSGEIRIDTTPLTRENVRDWLPHVGYVSQKPYILDASLAENVAFSRWGETIDRERVLECCRMAALDFLDELENGIDTRLGDRGARLSGGQIQRVAIARALYSRPEVLIFDEGTSALDSKNESAIYDTILSLKNSMTIIIIAHRLTTVESCDHIVWLEDGVVKMEGDATTVLAHYRDFVEKKQGH